MEDIRIEISMLPRDMHFSKEKKIWSVAEDHWSLISGEYISSELLTYDEAVSFCYKVFTLLDIKTFIVFVDNNTRIELGEKAEFDNLLISSPVENRDAPEYEKIWAVVNVDKNIEISDKKVTIPQNRKEVGIRPVSSITSRNIQSSGLSPCSKCPPTPIHLSLFTSFFFTTR